MNILRKIIALMINIIIITVAVLGLNQNISYAANQKLSDDINSINDKKYPGIKSMINSLKKTHPKWNFKVLYTGLDWEDAISGEYVHGRNLVPANNKYYMGDWVCRTCENKAYDNGSWRCASDEALEYMMDPRNSLNSSDIFQFLQLSYVDCTYNDLKTMVANYNYLNNKTLLKSIINIGKQYNVNPYYIIARIIQEQGAGTSVLVTGKSYKGTDGVTYSGYYNAFNINASGNSTAKILTNALSYSKSKEWNTLAKSIEGGITTIATNYVKNGQDTMYTQKFNVSSKKYSYYTHQYMQNVLAAQSEGTTLRKQLQNIGILEEGYTFVIPLYENMPKSACKVPSRTRTNNKTNNNTKDRKNDEDKKSTQNNTKVTYSLGDANNDNKINSTDLLVVQKYLLKTLKITDKNQLESMDVNKDSKINSTDLLLIKKHLLGTYKITQ